MVKVKKAAHKPNTTTAEPPKTAPSPVENQARPLEEQGGATPLVAGPPLGVQTAPQEQEPASEEAGPRPTAGAGSLLERMAALSSAARYMANVNAHKLQTAMSRWYY